MSDPTYEIVFRGKILKDFDRATVRRNLAQLFRTDEARIDAMLDSPKVVLKRGLSKEAGQKMQEMLRTAGIMVAVLPEGDATAPAAAPAPAATQTAPAPPAPVVQRPAAAPAPAPAAATPDPGGITLAPVGALMLDEVRKPVGRTYNIGSLSMAETGATLVEAPKRVERVFDTSLLELAPVEERTEEAPSALSRELSS